MISKMRSGWIPWKICRYQMQIHYRTGKTLLIAALLFGYIREMLSSLVIFSRAVGEPITIWTYAILMNDNIFPFIITILYIIWICDAPFLDSLHLYLIGRCGKKKWIWGEMLFLGVSAFLYGLTCFFFTLIASVPYLGYEKNWGKVLGTLAFTNASLQYPVNFEISTGVLSRFSPQEALFYTLVVSWLIFAGLGLFIFFFNWISNSFLGTGIVFAFSAMDITITNMLSSRWYFVSPVSMMRISIVTGAYHPSFRYAGMFVAAFLIFPMISIITAAHIKKGI